MKFEVVNKYKDAGLNLPVRKTAGAAGYDFEVAEDIIIPPYNTCEKTLASVPRVTNTLNLSEVAQITKLTGVKPTLVPTGIKCELEPGTYLELSVRSSCPLKYWLILANGVGIIDADYYNNPDNEGEIFFQIINLSPFNIQLKKGDIIGQGIIKPYFTIENDNATALRTGGFGSTDSLILNYESPLAKPLTTKEKIQYEFEVGM